MTPEMRQALRLKRRRRFRDVPPDELRVGRDRLEENSKAVMVRDHWELIDRFEVRDDLGYFVEQTPTQTVVLMGEFPHLIMVSTTKPSRSRDSYIVNMKPVFLWKTLKQLCDTDVVHCSTSPRDIGLADDTAEKRIAEVKALRKYGATTCAYMIMLFLPTERDAALAQATRYVNTIKGNRHEATLRNWWHVPQVETPDTTDDQYEQ